LKRAEGRAPDPAQRRLHGEARAVASRAYAPYSGYAVGAVVVGPSGSSHRGVNVENASYPAGTCAERVALGAMVTAGEREARTIAVATADGRDAVPCGLCLQALAELGDPDVVCRVGGEVRVFALRDLLTTPFAAPSKPAIDHRPGEVRAGETRAGETP
jgi:cytidine deaminase